MSKAGPGPGGDIAVERIEAHRAWADDLLKRNWAGPVMVTRGRLHYLSEAPGFVALIEGEPAGLVTYRVEGKECEITSLDSLAEGRGVGTALIGRVAMEARKAGCRRLWLVTTNDNVPALRFYQRRGFRLAAVYPGAMEEARRLKSDIPPTGNDGIPIRDELELELPLQEAAQGS
jgi:GNAT superfamily N-acetyltransferase